MAATQGDDHWSSEAYQNAASFVPKLASKVVQWLDAKPDDRILDIGCGDGVLTKEIAQTLTSGYIHGTDSSPSMIATAQKSFSGPNTEYSVVDSTKLISTSSLQTSSFTKVFSNAALHWILRAPSTRKAVFQGIARALAPNGTLVFEMGGQGNVAEMRAALLAAVGKRIGIEKAREAEPWFFPDQRWMADMLGQCGFVVEMSELEYRPTRCEEGEGGGVEGWVRLMGKQFFDAVQTEGEEREECIGEVTQTLESVCLSPSGGSFIGYVRLRVKARKL